MRKGTKSFISILSLGVVATGYQVGQAAEISSGFSASAPISGGTTSGSTAPIASGTTSAGSETLNMDQFNPKKAELIALAEKHKAATEIQIVDKASYDKVHEAQIELRDTRNAIKDQ